ncbi:MAG: hypothetical protein KJ952_06725, partial [Candidatus Omnitrophica bacterium]|nr:hypothetical protein [Candidatus Omnitrophota bacterium]
IVRNEGGKFTVYPLWIFSSDGMDLSYEFMKLQFHSFPLKAIFFLQQSKKFALKEMNFLDKISMISKNSLLFSENIRDSREDFFLSVHSISKNKHIYKLCYDRSDKIFPLLDSYDE